MYAPPKIDSVPNVNDTWLEVYWPETDAGIRASPASSSAAVVFRARTVLSSVKAIPICSNAGLVPQFSPVLSDC